MDTEQKNQSEELEDSELDSVAGGVGPDLHQEDPDQSEDPARPPDPDPHAGEEGDDRHGHGDDGPIHI